MLNLSLDAINRSLPSPGEHDAFICRASFVPDSDSSGFLGLTFMLEDGTEYYQSYEIGGEYCNTISPEELQHDLKQLLKLAEAIGIDLQEIKTPGDLERAFQNARVVIHLKRSEFRGKTFYTITGFSPFRLR